MGRYTFKADGVNVHYTANINGDTQEISWSWYSETPFGPKGEGHTKQTFDEYKDNGASIRHAVPIAIHEQILGEISHPSADNFIMRQVKKWLNNQTKK